MKDALKDAVDLIENYGGVILTGVGKSFDICQTAESSWHSFEISAWAMDPIKALHGDLGRLRKGKTVVIALSNSGTTDEMRPVIEKIRKWGNPLVVLTMNANSWMPGIANVALIIPQTPEADHEVTRAPSTSALQMLQVLYIIELLIAERKDYTYAQFKENHPGGAWASGN
jgi:arabinose-5-phosphate isomerase